MKKPYVEIRRWVLGFVARFGVGGNFISQPKSIYTFEMDELEKCN